MDLSLITDRKQWLSFETQMEPLGKHLPQWSDEENIWQVAWFLNTEGPEE